MAEYRGPTPGVAKGAVLNFQNIGLLKGAATICSLLDWQKKKAQADSEVEEEENGTGVGLFSL